MASSAFVPGSGTVNDAQAAAARKIDDGRTASATVQYYDWDVTPVSTATTTVVKSGAGQIGDIVVVGGTLGNVTVYDNTAASGTVLVPTHTPPTLAGQPCVIPVRATVKTGVTVVTAAATALTVQTR